MTDTKVQDQAEANHLMEFRINREVDQIMSLVGQPPRKRRPRKPRTMTAELSAERNYCDVEKVKGGWRVSILGVQRSMFWRDPLDVKRRGLVMWKPGCYCCPRERAQTAQAFREVALQAQELGFKDWRLVEEGDDRFKVRTVELVKFFPELKID